MKKTIIWFLREEWLILTAGLCAPLLFLGVFVLYQLAIGPFLYAAALYYTGFLMVTAFRLLRRYRLDRDRRLLVREFGISQLTLPDPTQQPDEAYGQLLQAMSERVMSVTEQRQRERAQASAYYTMWVHQIKTPIAAMYMLLQSEDIPLHHRLRAELFRIERYAEMALNYIRLEEGGSDLVFRECSLDRIIRSAIRRYAPQFIAGHLSMSYEPTEVMVLTDEKWLGFLLEQLLSNAVKYTHSGGITISVTQAAVSSDTQNAPHEQVILSVKDTGIGIPKEDLPRIFEKGFTGQNGRVDEKATGLGLYLCRRTADMLGISLWAESEPGVGSEFFLRLDRQPLVND